MWRTFEKPLKHLIAQGVIGVLFQPLENDDSLVRAEDILHGLPFHVMFLDDPGDIVDSFQLAFDLRKTVYHLGEFLILQVVDPFMECPDVPPAAVVYFGNLFTRRLREFFHEGSDLGSQFLVSCLMLSRTLPDPFEPGRQRDPAKTTATAEERVPITEMTMAMFCRSSSAASGFPSTPPDAPAPPIRSDECTFRAESNTPDAAQEKKEVPSAILAFRSIRVIESI
jgi:hypothetical protein